MCKCMCHRRKCVLCVFNSLVCATVLMRGCNNLKTMTLLGHAWFYCTCLHVCSCGLWDRLCPGKMECQMPLLTVQTLCLLLNHDTIN